MDENNLTTLARVRLVRPGDQPEIGAAVGVVHAIGDGWIEVEWPRFRSWHKAGDVEAVSMLATVP